MADKKTLITAAAALSGLCLLFSCSSLDIAGMFFGSSPSANERFARSAAYNETHAFRTIAVSENDYKLYVCADAHLDGPGKAFRNFVDAYLADAQAAPFALFLGDAVNGKDYYDYFFDAVDPVSAAGKTLFITPGNHDIYFGQWERFADYIGTASYTFEVQTPSEGKDLFLCMDSSSGTLGTDQRAWVGETLAAAKGKYRNIIVFTHTHFFKKDNSQGYTSNFNLEEGYDLAKLFKGSGVSLVLSGHDHHFEQTIFKDVRFLTLACIKDADEPVYYTFSIGSSEAGMSSFKAL